MMIVTMGALSRERSRPVVLRVGPNPFRVLQIAKKRLKFNTLATNTGVASFCPVGSSKVE
jgi:hypothetical protein